MVIRADDPWMESLLRMLRGQTPQKRLLMLLLLLLPHAVHFEMHLSINKYTSSKGKKQVLSSVCPYKVRSPVVVGHCKSQTFQFVFFIRQCCHNFYVTKITTIVTATCLYSRFIQQSLVCTGKHRSQFVAGVPAGVARHIGEQQASFGDA